MGCVLYEMCALVPPFRADDMNGLFKRVLRGQYPAIPSHYSMDLRQLIKSLLQVAPAARPNCDQILEMPIVVKRIKKYFPRDGSVSPTMEANQEQTSENELLKTIKLSKNVFKLSLPKAAYGQHQNYQTIPGSQATLKNISRGGSETRNKSIKIQNQSSSNNSPSKSPDKLQKDDVNLPKINTKKQSKRLASVDDDYSEDFEGDPRALGDSKS